VNKTPFELLNSHINVSCETFERLSLYHDLLLKWQAKINLIGKDTISDIWNRHFLDSLQLIKYLDDKDKIIVDLGSGAGFPGMALAIYGYKNVHLIESDKRKILFLKEVSRITDTRVFLHNCRIENNNIEKIDIFISRACASLDDLLQLIAFKVSRETICLFHKGKNYSKECDEALVNWQYDMSVYPSVSNSESVILQLSNISKR
jgi:16S rRNA (guanine527-N7)-methyltransferase